MARVRKCITCGDPLPDGVTAARKYCSDKCRATAGRRKKRAREIAVENRETPAMREFRELLDATGVKTDVQDYIREALQNTVRETVTEVVGDNILGAAEIITGMLPSVLAGLMRDLESKDWMIRSRAQAAVLKYAFQFKDKENDKEDLGKINVVHSVALPNTPLGIAVSDEAARRDLAAHDEVVEAFEKDWPVCQQCKERKPPGTLRNISDMQVCSSCALTRTIKYSKTVDAPGSIFEAGELSPTEGDWK